MLSGRNENSKHLYKTYFFPLISGDQEDKKHSILFHDCFLFVITSQLKSREKRFPTTKYSFNVFFYIRQNHKKLQFNKDIVSFHKPNVNFFNLTIRPTMCRLFYVCSSCMSTRVLQNKCI